MKQLLVEPLPCPFCGETVILYMYDRKCSAPYIECEGCHIEVRYADCIESAIELWNKRHI